MRVRDIEAQWKEYKKKEEEEYERKRHTYQDQNGVQHYFIYNPRDFVELQHGEKSIFAMVSMHWTETEAPHVFVGENPYAPVTEENPCRSTIELQWNNKWGCVHEEKWYELK